MTDEQKKEQARVILDAWDKLTLEFLSGREMSVVQWERCAEVLSAAGLDFPGQVAVTR